MSEASIMAHIAAWRASQPRFDEAGLIRWYIEGLPAGWVSPAMAERLCQSQCFVLADTGLQIAPTIGGPISRSAALQQLAESLAQQGLIPGWRGEQYDWLDDWGRVRLSLERGAFRTLGLCSRAVHVNGYVDRDEGGLWLAKRAASKAVDPGRWDNMTAGGISSGETPADCLIRELAEEAGVPVHFANVARPAGIVRSRRLEVDGVHDEMLYCYDLALPPDFVPTNRDGEVAAFELVSPTVAASRLTEMTWDAALVTADWLTRWLAGEI